ncbi:MAG: flagellar biosynthesis protein FlgB [Oscillospiraceae bacterium]|nr:flagellar biosynthesis protein FlgB [Oscillospiraceae bacterium]
MTDFFSSNSMLMLERAAQFQWTKIGAISDNVTNGDTPNYKAKYVTFEEALRSSILQAASGRSTAGQSSRGAIRSAISSSAPVVHTAELESARMDENGVNMAEQQVELTRTAYQMQNIYRAISSDMSRLLMAIRGQ